MRGSAAIEFAIVVPLVLALLLGLVEVAVVARTQLQVIHAAREGAREAATSPDPSTAVRVARAALGDAGPEARIGVRRPHVVGEMASVEVSLRHRIARGLLGDLSVEVSSTATMRVER